MDEIKGIPFWNYANPDDDKLIDKDRPRDQFWFRLDKYDSRVNNWWKLDFLSVERYLDTSWSWLSFQEININKNDPWTKINKLWESITLNNDGYITIWRNWTYLITTSAQNIKDWQFVVARLYEWPIWWYVRKQEEKDDWIYKPHMNLSVASLSFVTYLNKWDVLVPLCWTKWWVWLTWTLWFTVTKLS